jgi:hypothetical protein
MCLHAYADIEINIIITVFIMKRKLETKGFHSEEEEKKLGL